MMTKEIVWTIHSVSYSPTKVTIERANGGAEYVRLEQDDDAIHLDFEDIPDLSKALKELLEHAEQSA